METGTRLNHYSITSKLGEGGMGEVYRAEDTRLKRDVAIKVLPPDLANDSERIARMEREAQVLASLEHPNIAALYGFEEAAVDGRDIRFLVMQLAEGTSLAERLTSGPMPLEAALNVALLIAEGLESAHEAGVVHRDLKPANVQLSGDDEVKILDFGLAKAMQGELGKSVSDLTATPTQLEATKAGVILGTAAYMSPEQARGYKVDQRTDIWAFGAVLYEMLAGRQIFGGDTATDVLGGIVHKEPEWDLLPKDTPRRVRMLLRRCLRKDPKRRLQAIGDARVAIQDYLEDPVAAEADLGGEPSSSLARLLPWGVAAVLAAGLAGTFFFGGGDAADSQPPMHLRVSIRSETPARQLGSSLLLDPAGDFLLVQTGTAGSGRLWIRAWNEQTFTEIAGNNPYNPFLSPDGRWIGYVTPATLEKLPVSGGSPQVIGPVNRSRGASWSSTGQIVISPAPEGGLSLVSENGGEFEVLTEPDREAGEVTHRWPQFLPGGRHVLFTSHTQPSNFDSATLEIVDVETGVQTVVHRGGSYGRYVDSGHIVYGNSGSLFAVPFDIDSLGVAGPAVPVLDNVAMDMAEGGVQFSVSATGVLAYLEGGSGVPVYPVNWVSRFGLREILWDQEGSYVEPRFSPDGSKLTLTVLDDGNWDVWVYDIERDVATRLTFDEGIDGPAVWSPDGESLIFSSDRNGPDDLYRKRADGSGDLERITENTDEFQFVSDWSTDGRYALYSVGAAGKSSDVWYVDIESGEASAFVDSEFDESESSFSPDGRWVAYQSVETGGTEVYVRPFPPAPGKWQVSDGGGSYPRWTADSAQLIYRNDLGLVAVDIDTAQSAFTAGRPRQIIEGPYRGGLNGIGIGGSTFADWDLTPDGEQFVMFPDPDAPIAGADPLISVVTNWFSELRRLAPAER